MVMRYAHPPQDHQANAMEQIVKHRAVAEKMEKAASDAAKERAQKSNLTVIRKRA